MKKPYYLALIVPMLVSLACSLSAAPAAAPTLQSVAPVISPPPTVQPTLEPTLHPTTEPPVAPTPFTGTWTGPDPDDGSSMSLTLVQTGSTLAGVYSDSYSPKVAPPGYAGTVSGTVMSATTAQMTMRVSRHDGSNLVLQANLELSGPNTLGVRVVSAGTSPWVLTRP